MFNNLNIRSKLLMGFGIVLTLMLISAAVTFYQFNAVEDVSRDIVEDAIPVGQMAEQILTELINEETGVRGYLATGDAKFLEPYNKIYKKSIRILNPFILSIRSWLV